MAMSACVWWNPATKTALYARHHAGMARIVGDSPIPVRGPICVGSNFVDAFDAQRAVHARKNDCFRIIAKAKKSSAWPAVAPFALYRVLSMTTPFPIDRVRS